MAMEFFKKWIINKQKIINDEILEELEEDNEQLDDEIANAFYDEDYKKLQKLTGIKATSLYEFEQKHEQQKNEQQKNN